jgi:putative heme-binding domain-containing protein
MIEDDSPAVLKAVVAKLTDKSRPTDDVHYLICLSRLKTPRTKAITEATVRALLSLEPRLDRLKAARDTNWPIRMAELHAGLAARGPALNSALLASPLFGHPEHVVFTRLKGIDKEKAAHLFLKKAKEKGFAWNAELVRLVGTLPAKESLPVLRKLWGEAGLDEALLPILARHAREEDHGRLLIGLGSAQIKTVQSALSGLEGLKPRGRDEVAPLILALRQLPQEKATQPLRDRLLARLEKATGHKEKSLDAWAAWAAKKYPEVAPKLQSTDGVDMEAWDKRLARVAWDKGDATRGLAVFTKASCASCHSGAAALGPDLKGVAGRFSRADLFTAILRPSKDVPPRYRVTQLITVEGNVYQGIIVYEAVGSVLLQTGPATTVRIANRQIASQRLLSLSLMPTGLLDRLTDVELADLDAHLRSLKR